ncbi:MAG: 1-phosphofructokinase family hexose kinase [Christensenellales bacterium]|jgi:1-phosphofructokinase family hexose kinase
MILTVTLNPCLDKTIWVDQLRLDDILRADHVDTIAGGKGSNVSSIIRAFGYQVVHLVVLAGDTGRQVERLLDAQRMHGAKLWVQGQTRTVTTVVEQGSYRQVAFVEPGPVWTKEDVDHVLFAFSMRASRLHAGDWVILSGSVPEGPVSDIYRQMIELAHQQGLRVLLDSRGEAFARAIPAEPEWIKPNRQEAQDALGYGGDDDALIAGLLERGAQGVLLSLGEAGVRYAQRGQKPAAIPAFPVETVNPVGSGDALVAGFILAQNKGCALEDCIRAGSALGAVNAARFAAGRIEPSEAYARFPELENLISRTVGRKN